jgi:hypothetical protein
MHHHHDGRAPAVTSRPARGRKARRDPVTGVGDVELLARLALAALLGMFVGLEREHAGHTAGVRTHLLVAVGSALFTELSIVAFPGAGTDTARVAAQIVSGIGFLAPARSCATDASSGA